VFGHSRMRTDHACRILGLNACAAGLSGGLHCRLVEGDGKQALLCKLAIRGTERGSRRVKHVQRARMIEITVLACHGRQASDSEEG